MNRAIRLTMCGVLLAGGTMAAEKRAPLNQFLVGGGSSIPGWGETTERVQTLDLAYRHCRHFFSKDDGWIRGSHEFWVETPVMILLSDSDDDDSDDFAMFSANFLAVWVFPDSLVGEPYMMVGGGPVYVMADIDGVGSDLCGNYQAGVGVRFRPFGERPVNLELRYHHISNLDMADPNVPLNSVKFFAGVTLPF